MPRAARGRKCGLTELVRLEMAGPHVSYRNLRYRIAYRSRVLETSVALGYKYAWPCRGWKGVSVPFVFRA